MPESISPSSHLSIISCKRTLWRFLPSWQRWELKSPQLLDPATFTTPPGALYSNPNNNQWWEIDCSSLLVPNFLPALPITFLYCASSAFCTTYARSLNSYRIARVNTHIIGLYLWCTRGDRRRNSGHVLHLLYSVRILPYKLVHSNVMYYIVLLPQASTVGLNSNNMSRDAIATFNVYMEHLNCFGNRTSLV